MSVKIEHHALMIDHHKDLNHHSPTAKKPVRLFNNQSPNKNELKIIVEK